MAILNYTTTIDAGKSIAEIQKTLVAHGAKSITIDYDDQGNPAALSFAVQISGVWINFRLPSNWKGVRRRLDKDRSIRKGLKTDEQAIRISWRILKDWTESQMAIIEAELAELAQVFLPYAVTPDGSDLYSVLKTNHKLLTG